MKKHEFLTELANALSALPQDEVQKTIDYYAEMIDDAVEDGGDEESIVAGLGSAGDIAQKILHDMPASRLVPEPLKKHHWNAAEITLLAVGSPIWISLLLAAAAIVFSLYVSVWAIVVSLFATTAALALSGVALLAASPFLLPVMLPKATLFCGTALISLGISVFLFYLSIYCAKQLIRFTVFGSKKIKNLFERNGGASDEMQ